jgi:hypothetical protein
MKSEGEPWPQMNSADADLECGVRGGFTMDTCGVCKSKVVLHCDRCQIQVSGCQCILAAKLEEEREFDRKFGEIEKNEALRDRLAGEGLWLPPV